MFLLRSVPMPNRKWGQARDGNYSWRTSPLREPMPREPSRIDEIDVDEDELDEVVSAIVGDWGDSAAAGWSSLACSSATFSRNVADGTKKRFPVAARLKSSSR